MAEEEKTEKQAPAKEPEKPEEKKTTNRCNAWADHVWDHDGKCKKCGRERRIWPE